MTSAGTRTRGSSSVMFTLARISSNAAAVSGEVVFRQSSLNHESCSGVPSGMKREVKICRKAGFSFPHPMRSTSMMARYSRSASGFPRW
jgi:hypothetical protein